MKRSLPWPGRGSAAKRDSSGEVEANHPDVGHLLDGEADSFSADAAHFVAAIRHLIDAEDRRVVDHHPSYVHSLDGLEGFLDVASVDPGLKSVGRAPQKLERLREGAIPHQRNLRGEGLLTH